MQNRFRTALLAAGIGTMLAGSVAYAQQPPNPPPPPPRMDVQGIDPRGMGPGGPGGGPGGWMQGGWHALLGLKIAERLNAMHTYLGITPQQQPAWDAFSQAALAMVPEGRNPHEMARLGAFEGIDRMTQRLQVAAQNAQRLDQAAQSLKAVLTPDQIGKADELWRARMEQREHRWGEWMHRWLHRDDRGGRDGDTK